MTGMIAEAASGHEITLTAIVAVLGAAWLVLQVLGALGVMKDRSPSLPQQPGACSADHGRLSVSLTELTDQVKALTEAIRADREMSRQRHEELIRSIADHGRGGQGMVRT